MHLLLVPLASTPTAKLENCFFIGFLQAGQVIFLIFEDFCSISSILPQFWHLYSNIGIILLLISLLQGSALTVVTSYIIILYGFARE
jgi:hypothetical protein